MNGHITVSKYLYDFLNLTINVTLFKKCLKIFKTCFKTFQNIFKLM